MFQTLEVQRFLNNNSYELLNQKYDIECNFHPTDDRVILNYNHISSPKYDQITRECRSLVLNKTDNSLVARSFFRFFNWGEDVSAMKTFAWDNCTISSKEDGSLITLYNYNGKWCVNTRNSYADSKISDCEFTWEEIFWQAMPWTPEEFDKIAHPGMSLIFELCSPFNQIVRHYGQPTVFLLAIFDGIHEWNSIMVDGFAKQNGFLQPFKITCKDPFEVTAAIAKIAETDKTFEGFVLRDCHNTRFKFKSETYLALHRLSNNGNVASTKNLVPLALDGETDEIVSYFPYLKERLDKVSEIIQKLQSELDNIFFCHWDVKSRKKFADEVKKHPLSCILFSVYGKPYGEVNMRKEMQNNVNKIIEYVDSKL